MKQTTLTIGQDVRGKDIDVQIYKFIGSDITAPKTYMQASMHGAEIQGNLVIYNLIRFFKKHPPLGDIILIPHCNPIGANHKVGEYTQGRFDPICGENWNRQYFNPKYKDLETFAEKNRSLAPSELTKKFREYLIKLISTELEKPYQLSRGERMAYHLQRVAYGADQVLDIHTDSYAMRYVYTPTYALTSAKAFELPHVLQIDNEFGGPLDEAIFHPWWNLSDILKKLGYKDTINLVDVFTLELGSQELIKTQQAHEDTQCILKYLKAKKSIQTNTIIERNICESKVHHIDNMICFNAPIGGLYEFSLQPGEFIKAGDVFATCFQTHSQKITPMQAPCDGYLVSQQCSSAIPQGVRVAKFFKTNF